LKNLLFKYLKAIKSKLIDQWQYIYLVYDLDSNFSSLPKLDDSITIRLADRGDLKKIKEDIFPEIEEIENDKTLFEQIGQEHFDCFIALRGQRIIHYFQFYYSAKLSPLTKTPYGKKIMENSDAYLGSTYTSKDYRSMWIVPHTITKILDLLKERQDIKRALVLVHSETVGAENFYKRLGFEVVNSNNNEK